MFEQAAAGLAGHAVILEKDLWVSWLLGLLFAQPKLAPFLVFKGGTSLSKVFGVIDRFSEDIDLCLVPEFVGADAAGFDALTSRVKRDAAVLEMQRRCADKVQCERVVDRKTRVFARSWARYDLAGHGTFRLVPPEARQPALARDYAIMRPMFMTEPPGFDMLLRELGRAENLINSPLPAISTHSPSSPT